MHFIELAPIYRSKSALGPPGRNDYEFPLRPEGHYDGDAARLDPIPPGSIFVLARANHSATQHILTVDRRQIVREQLFLRVPGVGEQASLQNLLDQFLRRVRRERLVHDASDAMSWLD